MEKQPQFIKKFSKEKSSEKRKEIARQIWEKRAEYFAKKREKNKLQENIGEREKLLQQELEKIKALETEIERISQSVFGKLKDYFKLRKLRAELKMTEKTYENLSSEQEEAKDRFQRLSEELDKEKTPKEFQEAKEMLKKFYDRQKEFWANSPYSKEDIAKYFTEEHLASLSLEDYVLLLKRFPSEMYTHVTRQGVRDHFGIFEHRAGLFEYHDSFMKILDDGRLRSPLGVYLAENKKEEAIARFLKLDTLDKEGAINKLNAFLNPSSFGGYPDTMALHFALNVVADKIYGAESGNEIFFVYPKALIVSQYYFSDYSKPYYELSLMHNDMWVWANEEKGIDLNASIVFIPEEAQVDRKTGSQYELDDEKNPVINREYFEALKQFFNSPYFYDFAKRVSSVLEEFNKSFSSQKDIQLQKENLKRQLEPFRRELEEKFQIQDTTLQDVIFYIDRIERCANPNVHTILKLKELKELQLQKESIYKDSYLETDIKESLSRYKLLYKRAKNTVSSKEFWENYFAQHPDKRPKHIVYYKGDSPTKALGDWLEMNGLRKRSNDPDLGFSERNVSRESAEAIKGSERFRDLAMKVIEDYYDKKEISLN